MKLVITIENFEVGTCRAVIHAEDEDGKVGNMELPLQATMQILTILQNYYN